MGDGSFVSFGGVGNACTVGMTIVFLFFLDLGRNVGKMRRDEMGC
jgi:hypothetical protein